MRIVVCLAICAHVAIKHEDKTGRRRRREKSDQDLNVLCIVPIETDQRQVSNEKKVPIVT